MCNGEWHIAVFDGEGRFSRHDVFMVTCIACEWYLYVYAMRDASLTPGRFSANAGSMGVDHQFGIRDRVPGEVSATVIFSTDNLPSHSAVQPEDG